MKQQHKTNQPSKGTQAPQDAPKARPAKNTPRKAKRATKASTEGSIVDQLWVGTCADVAREFGVERSTVHTWKAKGMPGRDGAYNLAYIARWLLIDGPWKSEKYRQAVLEHAITIGGIEPPRSPAK